MPGHWSYNEFRIEFAGLSLALKMIFKSTKQRVRLVFPLFWQKAGSQDHIFTSPLMRWTRNTRLKQFVQKLSIEFTQQNSPICLQKLMILADEFPKIVHICWTFGTQRLTFMWFVRDLPPKANEVIEFVIRVFFGINAIAWVTIVICE